MNKLALAVTIALVAALCSSAFAGEDCMKKIEEKKAKCKAELKLTDEDIVGLDKEEALFTNGTKCLIACIAEHMDIYKNGSLVEKKVLSMIDDATKKMPAENKERDLAIYKECKDIVGKCPCDTAAKMYVCVRESAKMRMGANMPMKKSK